MRERLPLFVREHFVLEMSNPRPSPDIRDRVFALIFARKVVSGLAGIFARQVDLENAEDAESFVGVPFNSIYSKPPPPAERGWDF